MNIIQSPFNRARQDKFLINFELPKLLKAHKDSKFFECLKNKNVPILDRADVLRWLCSKFKKVIAL